MVRWGGCNFRPCFDDPWLSRAHTDCGTVCSRPLHHISVLVYGLDLIRKSRSDNRSLIVGYLCWHRAKWRRPFHRGATDWHDPCYRSGEMALGGSYIRTTRARAGFRRRLLKYGSGGLLNETRGCMKLILECHAAHACNRDSSRAADVGCHAPTVSQDAHQIPRVCGSGVKSVHRAPRVCQGRARLHRRTNSASGLAHEHCN